MVYSPLWVDDSHSIIISSFCVQDKDTLNTLIIVFLAIVFIVNIHINNIVFIVNCFVLLR